MKKTTLLSVAALGLIPGFYQMSALAEPPEIGSPVTSTPGEAEKSIRDALVNYEWSLHSPARKVRVRFKADGTLKCSDRSVSTWKIIGDRQVLYGEGTTLTFNESFTAYKGYNEGRKWKLSGERKQRIGEESVATTGKVSAPTPTPEAARPAVAKSTLEGFAENGPVVTDQVLAPLDKPSIQESTLTLWREDLLDEAAKSPAAYQQAYVGAASLVDAWKLALRERDQIIGKAQFAGAVTEVTDMNASKKTTLHFWDWLEYERERDDAAKHEVTLERKADFFSSGPPKRWAERSKILREQLEKLYAAFRQSRREAQTAVPVNP